MTEYSLEPAREDLILHLTFDDRNENGEPLDISPQASHGSIALGSPGLSLGGTGLGMEFEQGDQVHVENMDLDLQSHGITLASTVTLSEDLPEDPSHASSQILGNWTSLALGVRLNSSGDYEVYAYLDGNASKQVADVSIGEVVHLAVVYEENSTTRDVYVNGSFLGTESGGTAIDASGQVQVGPGTNYNSTDTVVVDEARIYRRELTASEVSDLADISLSHQQTENLADVWNNPGLPYRPGAGNANLSGALGEAHDANFRDLDRVRDAIHIDHASGYELDKLGRGHGILRPTGEVDDVYRARIKGILAAGRSRGTFEDLLEATAVVLETTEDRVFIDEDFDLEPATAFIYARTEDLEAANLTSGDATSILEDAVPGGHDIQVISRGANPFTLTDDASANDPDLGLTSDAIGTGGGLVADV